MPTQINAVALSGPLTVQRLAFHRLFMQVLVHCREEQGMEIEALAALAGNALVTAAVTDAWEDLRHKIAGWFGRGQPDPQTERRLDDTRQQLTALSSGDVEQVQANEATAWQTRFSDMLADHPEAADELDALVREVTAIIPIAVKQSGAAGRDMIARADHGSAAANVLHGNITVGPTKPGSSSS